MRSALRSKGSTVSPTTNARLATRFNWRSGLRSPLGRLSIVLGLFSLALPAQASEIFWRSGNTIGSANLDGTGVNQSLLTTTTTFGDIAADGSYVYWANGSAIGRANRDGSGVDQGFFATSSSNSVAVDGDYLYWGNPNSINRTGIDGTGANQFLFETYGGGTELFTFAIDDSYIYYALQASVMGGASSIGRANLDGTSRDNQFIPLGSAPFGMAVDQDYLYLAAVGILRVNVDGTGGLQPFISAGWDVAVYGDHIYWTNYSAGTIGRANIDGSDVDQNFVTGLYQPTSIVVVPEPTTGLLVMLGLLGLAGAAREA